MNKYLVHHGILGQKWGVRRYQNKDGSLTEEGKQRYQKMVRDYYKKEDAFNESTNKTTKGMIDVLKNAKKLTDDIDKVTNYKKEFSKIQKETMKDLYQYQKSHSKDVDNYYSILGDSVKNMGFVQKYATYHYQKFKKMVNEYGIIPDYGNNDKVIRGIYDYANATNNYAKRIVEQADRLSAITVNKLGFDTDSDEGKKVGDLIKNYLR